jgi:hypothetical protein
VVPKRHLVEQLGGGGGVVGGEQGVGDGEHVEVGCLEETGVHHIGGCEGSDLGDERGDGGG